MLARFGRVIALGLLAALGLFAAPGFGADWPVWRYDAARGADSPHELAAELHLLWVREYPRLEPAWPDQPRLRFDRAYAPVVLGKRMFVASANNDRITALDTDTGDEQWTFYAEGPIRFAPVAWKDKVFFASDDGHLYCLDAATGDLKWKFRGGPSDRKVLGNGRLVSAWPARGAPVLADGRIFFAAGIWPFMGVFVYALDAETGRVVWSNDTLGAMYRLRPHYSPAFSGLAPQGYLAVAGDLLLVPNGRNAVAALDRETGRLWYHNATDSGTYHVVAAGRFYFNAGMMFDVTTGRPLPFPATQALAVDGDTAYAAGAYYLRAYDISAARVKYTLVKGVREVSVEAKRVWASSLPFNVTALITAGRRLYAAGGGAVGALDLRANDEPKVSWRATVDGTPVELLAADGKLFVVTLEGAIYCFGPEKAAPRRHQPTALPPAPTPDEWTAKAQEILKATAPDGGHCIVLGLADGRLAEELARRSNLNIVAVGRDAKKADALRRRLDAAGLYGKRAAVLVSERALSEYPLPPYLASVVASEAPDDAGDGAAFLKLAFHVLRPYGGTLCLPSGSAAGRRLAPLADELKLPGAKVKSEGLLAMLVRAGPLPGAGSWTHEHADAANTVASNDAIVRAPLGLLWFGGPSNTDILPRHGHGPVPQVVGGRLFIEGPDTIRALDVYTGRVLWQASLPGVGAAYDNTDHQPGANARGSNLVSLEDGVYVAYGRRCLRLDPATGKKTAEFRLPRHDANAEEPVWGCLRAWKDLLIAAADPIILSGGFEETNVGREVRGLDLDGTSSERIVALDRHTGNVRWERKAAYGFAHNAIAVGGGKVFCIDRPRVPESIIRDEEEEERMVAGSTLLALDAQTGAPAWTTRRNVFGTWLGYSEEHDILLQSGRSSRDMVWDEPNTRMIGYRGRNGEVLWDKPNLHDGPCIIIGDTIFAQKKAYSLLTGQRKMRTHPLTGRDAPWGFLRNYGCGTAVGSRNLLTFRSAAAGFFDLEHDGGTANLGGFRSGCTSSLIAADGVLSAPDYTRTCTCGYPNQASLALVHMPEVELWTFSDLVWDGEPIRRMGVNLGAPGARRADDGTLWLEHPASGAPGPDVPVRVEPRRVQWFRKHSSRIVSGSRPWVAASGAKGIERLEVVLARRQQEPRKYTVRLHFAEPDAVQVGDRVFDVSLQGQRVLAGFDVMKEAGGQDRGIVKEFRGVTVKDLLTVELAPAESAPVRAPVLCGVEVVADGW